VYADRDETVKALQTSVALSLQRYNDGITSYFEVLEAEQQLFPAELDLARTRRDELVAVVRYSTAPSGAGGDSPCPTGAPPRRSRRHARTGEQRRMMNADMIERALARHRHGSGSAAGVGGFGP